MSDPAPGAILALCAAVVRNRPSDDDGGDGWVDAVMAAKRELMAMELALRNVRGVALRLRTTDAETAATLLRFCEQGGCVGGVLR